MRQYLDLLQDILDNGINKEDRTGTGTISLFGRMLRFDLSEGFPLLTTKKVHFKSIKEELLWFLRGESNIKSLKDTGVSIWDEWADENGELGPVYGVQWRNWKGNGSVYDQIVELEKQISTNPNSRRLIVNAWNVAEISKMALPPCHVMFQFYIVRRAISCMMYQRSVDSFLGLPYNIASYALLTDMLAHVFGYHPGELILALGDTHLYLNHLTQAGIQLSREPRPLPKLEILGVHRSILDIKTEEIVLTGYDPYPKIDAPISV
ncbi:thymidylate synthase [candidate division WWE3 bacterium RBG_19FT_COMBO_34_6]|uniref:Thymidylate synthase n=1 Tax=candidate division WWE3 bacterium RBG_19FT_COMBO_34_6 TaxID=1802612 RepID=A0A1F4UK30_UNCKA|nr:MAG: thymidylate synthase [candidate division WWE3 bacterium RBG_19FT_COMBO_34_6]